MKCPKCGEELKQLESEPGFVVCDNCLLKFTDNTPPQQNSPEEQKDEKGLAVNKMGRHINHFFSASTWTLRRIVISSVVGLIIITLLIVIAGNSRTKENLRAEINSLRDELESAQNDITIAEEDSLFALEKSEDIQKEYDTYKEKMKPFEEQADAKILADKEAAEQAAADKKAAEEAEAAEKKAAEEAAAAEKKAQEEAEKAQADAQAAASTEQRNALETARDYLAYTAFSYSGLIAQLEYEGYSNEAATYAVDNCGADWNQQAAKMAQQYIDYTSFSRAGLIDQLVFEGFSQEQSEYGVSAVGY